MFCFVVMKFGLALVCSITRVELSLRLLPTDVRRQVVNILCPHLSEDDSGVFNCSCGREDNR